MIMKTTLLTIKEVASVVRVHPITVRRWILKGKLTSVRFGGVLRISMGSLIDFLEESSRKRQKEDSPGGDVA